MSTTFPNVKDARLLVNPALLDPTAYDVVHASRRMDLAGIARFCEIHFSFGSCAWLLCTLRTTLWHDEVLRMLLDERSHQPATPLEVSRLVHI